MPESDSASARPPKGPTRDIIVIGASAGGVEAMLDLVNRLPADLPAAVFLVVHVPSHGVSHLPELLSRRSPLRAAHAVSGETIVKGRIYVAPPNLHLVVRPGSVELSRSPRVNRSRPSVDVLFQSAARAYGRRVIGVVLTGNLDDGTFGLMAVKMRGGTAVVQNPEDALYDGMPSSALAHVDVDYVADLSEIPALLARLTSEPLPPANSGGSAVNRGNGEIDRAETIIHDDQTDQVQGRRHGEPSTYSCPDCGGVVWQLNEGNLTRFQCHVGHSYSFETMLVEQADQLERALWQAIRSLKEKADMARQMVEQNRARLSADTLARYQEQADAAQNNVDILTKVIESGIFNPEYESALAEQASEDEAANNT